MKWRNKREKGPSKGRTPEYLAQASVELEGEVTDWHQPKRGKGALRIERNKKGAQKRGINRRKKRTGGVLEEDKAGKESMAGTPARVSETEWRWQRVVEGAPARLQGNPTRRRRRRVSNNAQQPT
jgi:hypothetical protein